MRRLLNTSFRSGGCTTIRFYQNRKPQPPSPADPVLKKILAYRSGEVPVLSDVPEFPDAEPRKELSVVDYEKHLEQNEKDVINNAESIEERLDLLTPYERSLTWSEDKWHRPWHAPHIEPRRSWRLHSPPIIYNSLPFYQYATKTQPRKDRLRKTSGMVDASSIAAVMETISERLAILEQTFPHSESDQGALDYNDVAKCNDRNRRHKLFVDRVMQIVIDSILEEAFGKFDFIADASIDKTARIESFWVRSGYRKHYPDRLKLNLSVDIPKEGNPYQWEYERWKYFRLAGDSLEKSGQLSFCHRGEACVQIRHPAPLSPFVALSDAEGTPSDADSYNHYPSLFYEPTRRPLYMVPGFENGSPNGFSSFLGLTLPTLQEKYLSWDPNIEEPSERDEAILSAVIATAFSSLVGQAHFAGFSQHHPLSYPLPLTGLLALDGEEFRLFEYQLNTLDFKYDWRQEALCNMVWMGEPMRLRNNNREDEVGRLEINADLISEIADAVLVQPMKAEDLDLYPFYPQPVLEADDETSVVAKYAQFAK